MIKRYEQNGMVIYRLNDILNRPDGPAISWENGAGAWWLYGNPHRYYGPSTDTGFWFVHGIHVAMSDTVYD